MKDSITFVRPFGVTIRQLRAFLAVAHDVSITRAALRLHLSPSALSMLVSSLESELEVRLFERTTRRIVLTDAGMELLPSIQKVFEDLDTSFANVRQTSQLRGERLSVATSPLLSATLMPVLLSGFRENRPNIRVELFDLSTQEIASAVRAGQADVGILTEGTDTLDLTTKVLYQDKLMLACLNTHPLALRREVTWTELTEEALILLRHGSGLRTLVDRGFSEASETQIQASFEVAHVMTAVGLVEAGLGVTILPSYALTRVRSVGLAGVPLVGPIMQRNIVAVTASHRELPAPCEAFLVHFRREMTAYDAQQRALIASGRTKKRLVEHSTMPEH